MSKKKEHTIGDMFDERQRFDELSKSAEFPPEFIADPNILAINLPTERVYKNIGGWRDMNGKRLMDTLQLCFPYYQIDAVAVFGIRDYLIYAHNDLEPPDVMRRRDPLLTVEESKSLSRDNF